MDNDLDEYMKQVDDLSSEISTLKKQIDVLMKENSKQGEEIMSLKIEIEYYQQQDGKGPAAKS